MLTIYNMVIIHGQFFLGQRMSALEKGSPGLHLQEP